MSNDERTFDFIDKSRAMMEGQEYVLITGSRNWTDFGTVQDALSNEDEQKVILVHGGAQGADQMAGHVWEKRGGVVIKQPADWKKHGRAAGPIRNESMVNDFPISRAIAFWKGNSRGTGHMISILQRRKIPVHIVQEAT